MSPGRWIFCAQLIVLAVCSRAEDWKVPEIHLPKTPVHPQIACSAEELQRLKDAWKSTDAAHDVISKLVSEADKGLTEPLTFPPRGGQHNQWYQCDKCQRALVTVDATHHKCLGCGTIYSGEPYDDVVFERTHDQNLRHARFAAWAYAITGDKKYFDFAAKVLLGYAERYETYPFHDNQRKTGESGGHLYEQTLNEAYHMTVNIAPAFDLIFSALNDEERRAIREKLIKPMLVNTDRHRAGKSNWQSWHNAAFVWGGACLDDEAWLKKAIEDPQHGFLFQMKVSITSDGMWYENSWGYHFYTLSALVATADGCRRLGIDIWNATLFKKMFTLPVFYTMADGSLPRFGDDVNTSARQSSPLFESAYAAYKDEALLATLDDKPSFDSILLGRKLAEREAPLKLQSVVFPGAGHAILRTQGPAGFTAAFDFGEFGGFHGHFDKLSFVIFGCGQELGVDPGRAKSQAYRLPIHRNWYRATIAHNTIVVDKNSQEGASGELDCFAANEKFALAQAHCDKAYKGISQTRLMLLTPEYALIFDDCIASDKKEHRFDWCYHNRGKTENADGLAEAKLPADLQGAEFIRNVKSVASDKEIRVSFSDEKVSTELRVDAQPGSVLWTGDGVGGSVDERVPLAIVTRMGQRATFAAVIEPVAAGKSAQVEKILLSEQDGTSTITISRGKDQDTVTKKGKVIELRRGADVVLKSE
jgi:hypothetical protein